MATSSSPKWPSGSCARAAASPSRNHYRQQRLSLRLFVVLLFLLFFARTIFKCSAPGTAISERLRFPGCCWSRRATKKAEGGGARAEDTRRADADTGAASP